MKIYNCSLCAALAAVLLLTSCTQDVTESGAFTSDSRVVSFTAQTVNIQDETRSTAAPEALPLTGDGLELWLMPSETPMVSETTRGTQINSVEALSNFGVSAYRHGAIPTEKTLNEYLTDNNLKPDFFYNLEATKITGTQKFKLTKDFFWPTDDDVLSFFAYAPYGDENVELSAATEDGPQSINFKVDTDVKSQVDLITAQAVSKSHLNTSATPSVELNFTHQLTGIRFVIGDQFLKGWVKSISLKGVYTQGTYTIGEGWTLDDTKKGNFTISYNLDKPVAGTPGEEVSASDEVFMMIPHTFAADDAATIEVVYNDKYTDYVVSAPLKGQTWKAGKTVTYAITSNRLTTLRIGQIQFATTPEGAPKRIWEAGDKVGMYVVGADGKKLKHKNVPVTFDGANWNIDHTTSEGTIYKLAGESFYFYYPYSNVSNGQPTGYPEQCPELKATAPVFFEGVIDYSTIKTDQSTLANYIASDLQVARAEDDGRASMIKATMLRQRGLAMIVLGTKQAKKSVKFTNGVAGTTTYANVTATAVFPTDGNIPFQSGTKFYYFTKPGVATSINSSSTEKDAWHEALIFNIAAGSNETMTAYSDRAYWDYVDATWDFSYTGAGQSWTSAPQGTYSYTIECWGASGGTVRANPGLGGYCVGNISLTASQKLYACIGQQGILETTANDLYDQRWNGGGGASRGDTGGGATDFRLKMDNTSAWSNEVSLRSRIIVAAAGSGGDVSNHNGSNAGGLTGYGAESGKGGTQTIGGAGDPAGSFGIGGHSLQSDAGGGGGGYYGGGHGANGDSGGGGSSYISGHPGCVAIASASSTTPSTAGSNNSVARATHYSGLYFTSTKMIDGAGYAWTTSKGSLTQMPKPAGGKYASGVGHTGNGYARITLTRW